MEGRKRSFDSTERRRSTELKRSTRRFDEHWGAAENADVRLKCSDGVVMHVHSQIVSCWSPVLRDMVTLYPVPSLVEGLTGPVYAFNVEEDSTAWAAALDMIYPSLTPIDTLHWDILARVLLLADKYAMAGVIQRCVAVLLEVLRRGQRVLSLEPGDSGFVLRWLGIAHELDLPELGDAVCGALKELLPALACSRPQLARVQAWAARELPKEALLQMFEAALDASMQPHAMVAAQRAGVSSSAAPAAGTAGLSGTPAWGAQFGPSVAGVGQCTSAIPSTSALPPAYRARLATCYSSGLYGGAPAGNPASHPRSCVVYAMDGAGTVCCQQAAASYQASQAQQLRQQQELQQHAVAPVAGRPRGLELDVDNDVEEGMVMDEAGVAGNELSPNWVLRMRL